MIYNKTLQLVKKFQEGEKSIASYNDDGFKSWYKKLREVKPYLPENPYGQDYDYKGYFMDPDIDHEKILGDDPSAHFTDKYKKPSHPTFSNESVYSNKNTPGGEWVKNENGEWFMKQNDFTQGQEDKTFNYLMNTGEGYIKTNGDTIRPSTPMKYR